MRTIVVDDEPWMLKRFAIECESLPDIQLLGSFRNSLKALEFAGHNSIELAFLDVEMPELNGLELAKKLREITPEIIVIFVSAYDSYMTEAFRTKTADYYIMKPYNTGDLEAAVDRARLLSGRLRKAVFARTFGAFELFTDNKPVVFQDNKAKELFALLIDRRGGIITPKEAAGVLWQHLPLGEGEIIFHRTLMRLNETLAALHLDGISEKNELGVFIHTNAIDCDMYQFLDGDPKATRQYSGDYMLGYAWAEDSRLKLYQQSKHLDSLYDAQTRNSLFASIRTIDNPERTIVYMNDSFLTLVGYTHKEIKARFNNSFRAMVLREDFDSAAADVKRLFDEGKSTEIQYRLIGKDDTQVWVICKSEPPKTLSDDTREISSVLIDITETKAEQRELEQAAQHDSLTGLLNRSAAQARIEQYLASTNFTPSGALILMDVDNFKAVNDTYGHPFADTVLTDIASILTRALRSSDIVCRLGGDEMMIFLKGIDLPTAREKLKSAFDALHERLSVKTQRGELSCSFGGAMFRQDGNDYQALYANADRALYKAKETKNCIVWFADICDTLV